MSVFAFGNDELKRLPDLKKIEKCPSCGQRHRVGLPLDKDGVLLGLGLVTCPKSKKTYIVGVRGKRIPYRKEKIKQ